MAAYGSVANPVDLGPFSRIVGVHWRDKKKPEYIALLIQLQADNTDIAFHSTDPPPSGTEPAPDGYIGGEHYVSTAFRYFSQSILVGPPIRSAQVLADDGWRGALGALTVEGMPENKVTPYWFNRVTLGENDRVAGGATPSQTWHWVDPTGGDLAIPVPGYPELHFKAGPASIEMYGLYYTGANFAYQVSGFDPVWLWQYAGPSPLSLGNFPPALTITYEGLPYNVIGAKIAPSNVLGTTLVLEPRDGLNPNSSGDLWLLAERVTS